MSTQPPGFTLLELCLALAIGALLVLWSVPSIQGLVAERALKASYEKFDGLAAAARTASVRDQRTYALVWEGSGIRLSSVGGGESVAAAPDARALEFQDGEAFALQRPAALRSGAEERWVFWSNGTCEPAVVSYHGSSGDWQVRYDPLTTRGVFESSSTR